MTEAFDLWLEFEESDDDFDPLSEFANVQVTYRGTVYALNVWAYGAVPLAADAAAREGTKAIGGTYLEPPDLLVERMDRPTLERVFSHLIESGGLREDWQVPPEDRSWVVWRQDDNGNRMEVRSGLSESEALDLVSVLETKGHKQTYWHTRRV